MHRIWTYFHLLSSKIPNRKSVARNGRLQDIHFVPDTFRSIEWRGPAAAAICETTHAGRSVTSYTDRTNQRVYDLRVMGRRWRWRKEEFVRELNLSNSVHCK